MSSASSLNFFPGAKAWNIPEPIMIFSGALIFFLFSLVANFSASHDSITYLDGIVKGKDLFHQHHLLYHITAHYWLRLFQRVFPAIQDFYLVESFTAIWGAGSLAVVYSFFRFRFFLPVIQSVTGVTIIAFSFGMWFYSTNVEVYASSVFFILMALYYLSRNSLSGNTVIIISFLHCMAILFHQINILFTVVILYVFWKHRRNIPFLPSILKYFITGVILVGGLYVYIGWFVEGHNSTPEWLKWVMGYADGHSYWQPLSIKTPFNVLVGFSHAFIGGHFIFQLPFVRDYMSSSFRSHGFADEIFLSRNLSVSTAWILMLFSFLLAVIVVVIVIRFIRNFRQIKLKFGNTVSPFILCLAVYSLFFCFWMPEILEFWILQSVLVWMLLIGTMPYMGKLYSRGLLLSISLFLLSVNYFGSMRWLQLTENDWYYKQAMIINDELTEKDLVILQDPWILDKYFSYLSKAAVEAAPTGNSSWKHSNHSIMAVQENNGRIFIFRVENPRGEIKDTRFIDSLLTIYPASKKFKNTRNVWVIE